MEQEPRGTGPTRRRSTCGKDCARAEMEQEQSKRDCARERKRKQRDTASEESKAKEKESDRLRKKRCIQGKFSGDRYVCRTNSLDDRFAIFAAIPRSQTHGICGYNGYLLAYFWIFFCVMDKYRYCTLNPV